MLALILADRHLVGVVEQNVGRHQDRVGQQRDPDLFLAAGLLLELDHALGLAIARGALQQVVQLGVLGHMRLHHEQARVRIGARGQQQRGELQRSPPHVVGLVVERQRVQVGNEHHGVRDGLLGHDRPDRAHIVAQMQFPRRGEPGESS